MIDFLVGTVYPVVKPFIPAIITGAIGFVILYFIHRQLHSSVLKLLTDFLREMNSAAWPASGFADIELGVLLEPEVSHGETKVYTGVQA